MNGREALNLMDTYADRMNACRSTSGRRNNFDKMLDLWEKFPAVRRAWDYIENAFLLVKRFVKKCFQPSNASICYSCDVIKGNQLVYLIRMLDVNNALVWSKVGTTTRAIEKRMKEHLRYYQEQGIATIEVVKIWDCGNRDAEGLESYLRSEYIRKYPGTFRKNDRFFHVELDKEEAEQLVAAYLA